MTYETDIELLADDIRRWAGSDARIHDAIEQLIKLHQAEVDALAFEARELDRLLAEAQGWPKLVTLNVCELCLQPVDGLGICPRCESYGGLYSDDWRTHD